MFLTLTAHDDGYTVSNCKTRLKVSDGHDLKLAIHRLIDEFLVEAENIKAAECIVTPEEVQVLFERRFVNSGIRAMWDFLDRRSKEQL